ncbi:MAG TPA: NAD(P)-dependent oxidoreductase [Baekduia sp.]|nr:NAD(P)-dependent oxidoreductase [Baekduia sp.]
MRVLVAGATGAIGRPLVARLQEAGHEVSAIARSQEKAARLRSRGVEPHVADVFDRDAVVRACVAARPEVVVHQLTALPKALDPRRYAAALEPTNRLRAETIPHFLEGARQAGARKVIAQSVSFITAPVGPWVHDEDAPVDEQLSPAAAPTMAMERAVLGAHDLEGLVLRYGFFYGPGTYYAPDGSTVGDVRRRRLPIIGKGTGISSFIHVEDAADATVLALDRGAGVLNVTDDDPAPQHTWLPELAQILGAKAPRRAPAWLVRLVAGHYGVHFGTTLRGNSNARAKEQLGWAPARASWRQGFREVLA